MKKRWDELSLNKKALLAATVASSVAITAVSMYKFNQPDYVSIMSHLDRVSMQKIIPALESAKIEFKISPDNTTLFVDKSQENAASIILAKDGLPIEQTSGYSHLSNSKTPYLTKSAEQQLERQVLEENVEIAIKHIKVIQDADVSLALSENSAFLQDVKPSTASVVLTIKNGKTLSQAQVKGITNIVAHAVPNLDPKNVAIIDQTGRILSTANDENGDFPTQLSHKIEIERMISQKITQVVAPIVGLNNMRVNVSANINYDRTELTSDAPIADSVILSKQSDTNYDKELANAQGVAGALSNEPPKHATFDKKIKSQADDTGKGVSHKNITTNFVVGKTITHTKKSSGGISKLSVAVLIDSSAIDPKKRTQLLTTIKPIIEASIGFNSERGDVISIDTSSFKNSLKPVTKTQSNFKVFLNEIRNPSLTTIKNIMKNSLDFFLLLALYLMFFKPIIKVLNKNNENEIENENKADTIDHDEEKPLNPEPLSPEEIAKIHHQNLRKSALDHLENNPDAARDVFASWVKNIDLKTNKDRKIIENNTVITETEDKQ